MRCDGIRETRAPAWQAIDSAPKDGTPFEALYDDGSTEEGVYWAEARQCILGSRAGERGPGCMSTEVGLPVDPTHWRPIGSGQTLADAPTKSPVEAEPVSLDGDAMNAAVGVFRTVHASNGGNLHDSIWRAVEEYRARALSDIKGR
ncbi:hypothetical protein SAMN04488115_108106 [Bosea lathyri]|uniref:Uncharacterized protein n=1 Tax=Bosea lathyri TaxID=1036778 RepID=A0A1H6BVA2_9HYPH|nr:hypothetical protein SAMN04488115_108106 [Bosea lathyri]